MTNPAITAPESIEDAALDNADAGGMTMRTTGSFGRFDSTSGQKQESGIVSDLEAKGFNPQPEPPAKKFLMG